MARWEPRERGGVDMTRTTNARIAGFTYLFYAAIGICGDLLMRHAFGVEGDAAQLARFGEYATDVRIDILIKVLEAFSALRTEESRVGKERRFRGSPAHY